MLKDTDKSQAKWLWMINTDFKSQWDMDTVNDPQLFFFYLPFHTS